MDSLGLELLGYLVIFKKEMGYKKAWAMLMKRKRHGTIDAIQHSSKFLTEKKLKIIKLYYI